MEIVPGMYVWSIHHTRLLHRDLIANESVQSTLHTYPLHTDILQGLYLCGLNFTSSCIIVYRDGTSDLSA